MRVHNGVGVGMMALAVSLGAAARGDAPVFHGDLVYERVTTTFYELNTEASGSASITPLAACSNDNQPTEHLLKVRPDGRAVHVYRGPNAYYFRRDRDSMTMLVLEPLPGNTWRLVFGREPFDEPDGRFPLPDMEALAARVPATLPAGPDAIGGGWFGVPDRAFAAVVREVEAGDIASARRLMAPLLERHPESTFYQVATLDLALLARDGAALKGDLDRTRPVLLASPDPLVAGCPSYYEHWLVAWAAAQVGHNRTVDDPVMTWSAQGAKGTPPSIDQVTQFLDSLRPDEMCSDLYTPLLFWHQAVPNHMCYLDYAKVARVRADFWLLRGEPERAIETMAGPQRHASLCVGTSSALIGNLVGLGRTSILRGAWEHAFLDGFDDPARLAAAWPRLDTAFAELREARGGTSASIHWEIYRRPLPPVFAYQEATARTNMAVAGASLVHSGAAIRHRLLLGQDYPATATEPEPLLPCGLDTDIFTSDTERLRIQPHGPEGWTLYSIGPDNLDQGGTTEYDPTNGALSAGDLTLAVPRERKYPFPRAGQAPTTREAILARYPRGLPPDPFADRRGSSYVTSDTDPAVIWSYGPDTDQATMVDPNAPGESQKEPRLGSGACRLVDGTYLPMQNCPTQPEYDPTNGITSGGNIYLNTGNHPARARR